MNHFIFLEEWNNSAVAILFALFFIPVLIAYLLVNAVLKTIPGVQLYFGAVKKKGLWWYWIIQLGIFILLLGMMLAVAFFWK